MIKEKHIQWNRYVLTGLDSVHEKYRKINNKIINKCRNKRINYETNLLKEGPKKFNSYIRQQVTSKVSIPTVLHNNQGQTVTCAKDIAEAFADQFEGVFQMEPSGPLPILDPSLRIEPSITELTSTKVEQAIKELKTDSSPGPDVIPAILLQKCKLTDALVHIMQTSYETGMLPLLWKTETVTPIFKRRQIGPCYYRPISLTSVICKVMEKLTVKHIRNFLQEHSIISDQQHGFCPSRSTVSNLLSCLD
ncbi:reverse transcriptase (RNA-dependent DNA polymerase) domain-containing protein [Phthorimaea operculella]|nr:reverse transcriptase (RNA-dependent DNA polymerase) domain-containing protein [Phthorimaea operculella]